MRAERYVRYIEGDRVFYGQLEGYQGEQLAIVQIWIEDGIWNPMRLPRRAVAEISAREFLDNTIRK